MKNSLRCALLFSISIASSVTTANAQSTGTTLSAARRNQVVPQTHRTSIPTSVRQSAPKSNQGLTLSQRWAMACPALLAEKNHERMDSFDIWDRTPEYIEVEKKALREWWGISNREDLLNTFKRLDEGGGHRKLWTEMTEIKNDVDAAEFKAKHPKMDPVTFDRELAIVRKYGKEFGKKGILGWDYCRLIALCRWGVYCDYITTDEAWQKMMPTARALQLNFKSWEDLGQNYLVARKFWSHEETQNSGDEFDTNFKKLTTDPKSPWKQIPWKTDLAEKKSNGY